MVITDILSEFGAYYINNKQNMLRMFTMLRAATVTQTLFTPIVTDDTVWRASETLHKRLLQPFQKAFTPIDGAEFKPVSIEQFKMKVDDAQHPDDLEASWLGFLTGPGVDRTQWPFVRWYIETVLIPQAKEDEELNEIFWGIQANPTPGTAGDAGTAMNGINKIILDFIADSKITPITTGAPSATPATWTAQVEAFADDINKKYWRTPMQLGMSEELARRYSRGYDALYGTRTNSEGKNDTQVSKTNLTVVGLPSMVGSDGIWCTPKANAVKLLKRTENINNFEIEKVDRQVKFYTDYSTGIGFIIPAAVFVNDQFAEQGS